MIQQQLSQINGVGQITLGGGALPSVRVELEPGKLNSYGIGLEDVRAAIGAANANSAKGAYRSGRAALRGHVERSDQQGRLISRLVIAYRNGAPVRCATSPTCAIRTRTSAMPGLYNGKSAVLVIVYPMPGRQHRRDGRADPRRPAVESKRRCRAPSR